MLEIEKTDQQLDMQLLLSRDKSSIVNVKLTEFYIFNPSATPKKLKQCIRELRELYLDDTSNAILGMLLYKLKSNNITTTVIDENVVNHLDFLDPKGELNHYSRAILLAKILPSNFFSARSYYLKEIYKVLKEANRKTSIDLNVLSVLMEQIMANGQDENDLYEIIEHWRTYVKNGCPDMTAAHLACITFSGKHQTTFGKIMSTAKRALGLEKVMQKKVMAIFDQFLANNIDSVNSAMLTKIWSRMKDQFDEEGLIGLLLNKYIKESQDHIFPNVHNNDEQSLEL